MMAIRVVFRLMILPVLIGWLSDAVLAAEFRSRLTIRTPAAPVEGGVKVKRIQPVDRRVIEEIVRKLFESYGFDSRATGDMLDVSFPDRSRLLITMNERVPRDAKLRVLGIQSLRTLDQVLQTDSGTGKTARTSTVTVTVRSQLEFNDGAIGFQRLEGKVEYLLRVVEEMGTR